MTRKCAVGACALLLVAGAPATWESQSCKPVVGSFGQIRLRGEFNAAEATTSGDYTGNVCAG